MSNIIQLLPDHLANQIAAGEVIQRPASALKELMENAIDAGASHIQVVIKDAGKELLQVIDDGKGMNPMDARMSFERHATSKIKKIEDLFSVRTMGFRGEALASIAAVAQVEVKTKQADDELGTLLVIESSEIIKQEQTACNEGTSIAIKNLFYNVPARRKFLKSNTVEIKHIIDEFIRLALANPKIGFRLHNNGQEQFHLASSTLKARVIDLLGNRFEKNLVPIEEETDIVTISGFIGKPEAAFKTRGNQFLFINNRFIRSPYLHHAIVTAFEGLIEKDAHPFYVLFFEIDPTRVDVNVHPTKQEVKFEDDKLLYAYLQSATKHVLGKFNIAPALDFSLNLDIQQMDAVRLPPTAQQSTNLKDGYLYHSFKEQGHAHFINKSNDLSNWAKQKDTLFDPIASKFSEYPNTLSSGFSDLNEVFSTLNQPIESVLEQSILQWNNYLISPTKSGLMLLHYKRAEERIIYERLQNKLNKGTLTVQQLLFPITWDVLVTDVVYMDELLPKLQMLGFDVASLGGHTYSINGIPVDMPNGAELEILGALLEQVKENIVIQHDLEELLIRTLAKRMAQKTILNKALAPALIDQLFECKQPNFTPDGKPIYTIITQNSLDNLLH